MNKKSLPYVFLVLLLVVLAVVNVYKKSKSGSNTTTIQQDTKRKQPELPPSDNPSRTDGFNRRVGRLVYTKHARCRMGCRHIDESEVMEILEKGDINYNKSELNNTRGPKYALEGVTHDNQRVRIVFAQDAEGTAVVTVIDLGREWKCNCE
jgi:Domain of unknown function (DUF4258)